MEQDLWRLKQIGSNEKKSVRRLFEILHLPVSGQTFKFLQTMDQTSIYYNYYSKCQARPGDDEKTSKEENGKMGFGW